MQRAMPRKWEANSKLPLLPRNDKKRRVSEATYFNMISSHILEAKCIRSCFFPYFGGKRSFKHIFRLRGLRIAPAPESIPGQMGNGEALQEHAQVCRTPVCVCARLRQVTNQCRYVGTRRHHIQANASCAQLWTRGVVVIRCDLVPKLTIDALQVDMVCGSLGSAGISVRHRGLTQSEHAPVSM